MRGATAAIGENSQSEVSEALAQLRRGELSLDAYLDHCVEEATSHLVGAVSPSRLQFVRQLMRDELMSDPGLVELVRETTVRNPQRTNLV